MRTLLSLFALCFLLLACGRSSDTDSSAQSPGPSGSCLTQVGGGGSGCAEKPLEAKNLTGIWKSERSTSVGPMTYFQRVELKPDYLVFSQVCAHKDGRILWASVNVKTKLEGRVLHFLSAATRSEYLTGISCQVRVAMSDWKVTLKEDRFLLTNTKDSQEMSFIRFPTP